MDITHENKLVVKTINVIIDGRIPKNLTEFPIAIINREHFLAENMSENRGREILGYMLNNDEISPLSDDEFEQYQENFCWTSNS